MTDRLRWGILATGGIAHAFTNDLKLNGFTVQAVGSRSQAAADAFAAEFGIPNAHGSYEALVADPEVDVVYVSTPHPLHAANARLVLEAGKHVLVEKPFTLNAREAQEIADLAAARGLLALEAMWTRYLPHMVRIRELIADGALGEVRTLIADHTQKLPDDPGAPHQRARARRRRAARPRHLPGLVRVGPVRRPAHDPVARRPSRRTGADAQVANLFALRRAAASRRRSRRATRSGRTRRPCSAREARIEIDRVWYTPTTLPRRGRRRHGRSRSSAPR